MSVFELWIWQSNKIWKMKKIITYQWICIYTMISCVRGVYTLLTFGYEILGKSSWVLKIVSAKFIINSTFVHLFIRFVFTKNKNLYSLYNASKHKIAQYLEQRQGLVCMKCNKLWWKSTIGRGDPKAPFSIATTPRCRGGRYSIPRIASTLPLNRTL